MLLSSHPLTVSSPAIPPFLGAPALEPVRSRELTKDGGNSSQSGIDGVNPELVGRKTIYEMNHHTSQRTRHEVSQWELLANRQNGKTAKRPGYLCSHHRVAGRHRSPPSHRPQR